MDDLAQIYRVAKDVRSALGNLDYRVSKLLDRDGARPSRDGGSLVARMATCAVVSRVEKRSPAAVAGQYFGGDAVLRAATGPAIATQAGWAAELVGPIVEDIATNLLPESALLQLRQRSGLAYAFVEGGVIRVPVHAPTPSGAFVAEAGSIPAGALLLTGVALPPRKAASLVALTREVLQGSPGNIEISIRTLLEQDLRLTVDGVLLGSGAGDAINPPGLLAGLSPLTPAAAGTLSEKIAADVKALVAAVAPAMRPVLLVSGPQAATLAVAAANLPAIMVPGLPAGQVVCVDAAAFVSALGSVEFLASEEAVIHEDTTPLPIGTPGSPATVAAPSRSLFQTASTALRTILFCNWSMRRSGAVSFMTGVNW